MAKKTGYNGCFSHLTTGLFLKKLDDIKPDLIHFHNLHNCYINLPMLFNYIKKRNIPVVWTLHDCWPYTGHCPYYDYVNANYFSRMFRKVEGISVVFLLIQSKTNSM